MKMKEKRNACDTLVNHLIRQVKIGNQNAFGELMTIYEPLFHTLLNKSGLEDFNDQDIEDIKQELTLVFYHSILSFDLDQSEVRFGLYTKICMSNALITQIRKLRKQINPLPMISEEENHLTDALLGGDDPTEATRDKEAVDTLNRKIEGVLSVYEMKVWHMYLSGSRPADISLLLGKSEKSIENAIFRIKRKLRSLLSTS